MLAIVLLLLTSSLAFAQGSAPCQSTTVDQSPAFGAKRAKDAKAFLAELKRAIQQDDKKALAQMVSYPLRVSSRQGPSTGLPRTRTIRTPAEFLAGYDQVITSEVKRSVAAQRADCLFGNDQGAMIGAGELWFEQVKGQAFKIITINTPAKQPKPL